MTRRRDQSPLGIVCACGIFGRLVGQLLSVGDVVPLADLRRRCRAAFDGELNKVPMKQATQGQAATQIPLPRETRDLMNKLKVTG